MNEFDHVKNLYAEQRGPSQQWMARTRNRLTDEARHGVSAAHPRIRMPRLRFGRVAAAGSLVVAVVAGLIMSQAMSIGGGSAPATASADTILRKAAATAADKRAAGEGDFTYVKTKQVTRALGGHMTTTGLQWLSVDDSEPGLLREKTTGRSGELETAERGSCGAIQQDDKCGPQRDAGERVVTEIGEWHDKTIKAGEQQSDSLIPGPTYAYLRSLPDDPARLASMIREQLAAFDNSVGPLNVVSTILNGQVVPPETAATLFNAAQRFDGVTVEENVTLTASGERGTAVTQTTGAIRTALVFDRQTYDFLGSEITDDGSLRASTAIVEEGLVDETGQRP